MMTDAQPAPLQPPAAAESSLTLVAPAPPRPVASTSAPQMAPAVEAAALPGLDAKVESYLESLLKAAPRSPEFRAKATDVRTMGDSDIRQAAETSDRLLKSPVKALQEGGLSEGSKVGSTLSSLTELGRIGLTAVGDTARQAWELHQQAERVLLDEAKRAAADRPVVV